MLPIAAALPVPTTQPLSEWAALWGFGKQEMRSLLRDQIEQLRDTPSRPKRSVSFATTRSIESPISCILPESAARVSDGAEAETSRRGRGSFCGGCSCEGAGGWPCCDDRGCCTADLRAPPTAGRLDAEALGSGAAVTAGRAAGISV